MPILDKNTVINLEENEFELPVGYTDKDGVLHKTFKLREMTGEVDEAIADKKVRTNAGKIVTEAIYGVLESIGTITKLDRMIVRQLANVDRDYILLMNYLYSLGETVEWVDNCVYCSDRINVTVDVERIPVKFMTADEKRLIEVTLPNGIKGEGEERHKELIMSFPNGMVQERIFTTMDKNPAEALSHMMAMCTESVKGYSNYNFETFKKLSKKDRKHINSTLGEIEVGAEMNVEVECPGCSANFKSSIPLMNLLGE